MRYLADLLTFTRLILAIMLACLAVFDSHADIGVGFAIFVIAELTDAFDGALATKYPFPSNKIPHYRRYAAKYDIVIDTLTALAAALFFTLRVSQIGGLIFLFGYCTSALIIEAIVYGRLFGHPDDCAPHSLMKRNFPLAKKLIMVRRAFYLALIVVTSAWMLYASSWPVSAKLIIAVVSIIVVIFLWFFLAQRRHHISRDAVDIEDSLTKAKVKSNSKNKHK